MEGVVPPPTDAATFRRAFDVAWLRRGSATTELQGPLTPDSLVVRDLVSQRDASVVSLAREEERRGDDGGAAAPPASAVAACWKAYERGVKDVFACGSAGESGIHGGVHAVGARGRGRGRGGGAGRGRGETRGATRGGLGGERRAWRDVPNAVTSAMTAADPGRHSSPLSPADVLLQVAVFDSAGRQTQGFTVRASQRLTELRDRLYCVKDALAANKGPEHLSGFFYIEGTAYDDLRDERVSRLSTTTAEWATTDHARRQRELGAVPYIIPAWGSVSCRSMHATRFRDLSIRLGAHYAYIHMGKCQHLFAFTDMWLPDADSELNRRGYPAHTFQAPVRRAKCGICAVFPAKYATYGDKLTDSNPFYFCDLCYHPLHYDEDNNLLYDDFEVHPHLHLAT